MNRRRFLAASAASVGAATGCWYSATGAANPSYPAVAGGTVVPLGAVRRLIAERVDPLLGRCRYVADLGSRQVANPILIARQGERFDVTIENRLPQPTTVHFHGLTLAESQDGAGFDAIAPGAAKHLRFEIHNRAGLYWFHPHPHGFTAEQVHAGLAGLLVVTDPDDTALDAALALAPENRLALAVADVRVAGDLLQPYSPSPAECLHGWFGNRALINGRLAAHFSLAPGWVRVQLLNACNARGLLLAFRDGAVAIPFHLLGTDGGLLAAPIAVEQVFVHPAERLDIALDISGHRNVAAVSLSFDPRHQLRGGELVRLHPARDRFPPLAAGKVCTTDGRRDAADAITDGAAMTLFTLAQEGDSQVAIPPLPARISALPDVPHATNSPDPDRRLRLDFDQQAGFLIDGTPYRVDVVAYTVARGTREVWEIRNSPISMPHPMHLHGFGFRVLRRQGTFGPARRLAGPSAGRLPTDFGVKDTIVLWPNETVWVEIDFTLPQDPAFRGRQRYMFHCHNLEHEDGMMMQNFAII